MQIQNHYTGNLHTKFESKLQTIFLEITHQNVIANPSPANFKKCTCIKCLENVTLVQNDKKMNKLACNNHYN